MQAMEGRTRITGMIQPMTPHPPPRLPPYADALTGLRGIAALWVLLFHLWQFMGGPRLMIGPIDLTPLAARGHLGVDLFFVLSGYLIGGPWVLSRLGGPAVAVGTFWKRRFLRVFPAYWAQWQVLAGLAVLAAKPFPMDWQQALMSATLTFNLVDNSPVLNPVWWSLPVEWDFYLLAPLLALLLASRRRLPPALVLVVLACVGWRVLSWWMVHRHGADGIWVYRWVIQLPGRLDQFALGMLVAHAFALGHVGSSRRLLLVGGAATLLLVWLSDRAGDVVDTASAPWLFFQFTLFGCAFAALVAAAANPGPRLVQVIFGNRLLVFAGTISYSLYLWHFPVLQWLHAAALANGWSTADWRWALVAVAASVVLSWLAYRLSEQPFLAHRRTSVPAVSTPIPVKENSR